MPAALSIQQEAASRFLPGGLVGLGLGVEIGRLGGWIVHPFTQQGRAVDQVDSQAVEFVFVAEVAPDRVVRVVAADGFEGRRLRSPGFEGGVVVVRAFGVDLQGVAQLTAESVEGMPSQPM